nr:tRNA(His) guanylyltransferase 1-like isoform X1 [Tanacetum cinerariifolium]
MTNSDMPPVAPALTLVEKHYAVHNITNLVPVKLDLDELNYSLWRCFLTIHCNNFNVLKHIEPKTDDASASTPPTEEWLTADSIVKSWIILTLSPSLQKRFIKINPTTARDAWERINACAVPVCKEFPDIILAYGFDDEYRDTDHYSRRASKLVSVIVSLFTSSYRMKWIEFFPHNDMRSSALFEGEVLCLKASTDIQAYLAYKQEECDEKNLKNTCFWKLVESGKSEQEAHEILEVSEKGKGKQAKTEIRFQQFGINYKNLPDIFCQGSCILRTEIEDEDKRKVITVQAKKIASKNFLNGYSFLSEELTDLMQNASSIDEKHLNKWRVEHQMKQDQFKEIVYGYGASDEYSFVLEKNTELHQRRPSKLVSAICSLFTDAYVSKWKEFFPKKELQYAPRFDGRAVCYKSYKLIRDYLSWRQVDCHANNRHNTCFWALVKSGKSKREAQTRLQ